MFVTVLLLWFFGEKKKKNYLFITAYTAGHTIILAFFICNSLCPSKLNSYSATHLFSSNRLSRAIQV